MAISKELRELITPHLLHLIGDVDSEKLDTIFSEAYYTNYDDLERITLHDPDAEDIAVQFHKVNGVFLEITSWQYIQEVGERL